MQSSGWEVGWESWRGLGVMRRGQEIQRGGNSDWVGVKADRGQFSESRTVSWAGSSGPFESGRGSWNQLPSGLQRSAPSSASMRTPSVFPRWPI